MDARAHERRGAGEVRLEVAAYRLPLLALGFVSLAFGVAGGLARFSALDVPASAVALHGPLMVSAFFGTLISLERAVALGRLWGYGAPLAAGLGGVCLLAGFLLPGFSLLVAAAALFVACAVALARRQPSLETTTLLLGAAAWLAGNVMLLEGGAAVPWWIAFFVLTIAGERLELSRYLRRPPWVRRAFAVLVFALVLSPLIPRALGVVLVALAAWLLAFDLARVTIRQERLPRYVAACLLAGYVWLGLGGALIALATAYDAALHAIFVGFVLSMVFGHAPVILPAVLRVRFPYHPLLYLPLALLHASLALRVFVSAPAGGWGNAAAIALFIASALGLTLIKGRARAGR
ncbi:MAG TPA: hypothetical protein VF280_06900 [Burkholderiales bacterium]